MTKVTYNKWDFDEQFTVLLAKHVNGGDWSYHYNEEQKEYWREKTKPLIAFIKGYYGH